MLLATTIDGNDAAYVDRVVPLVDLVEISPDRWAYKPQPGAPARIPDATLDFLSGLAARVPVVAHGVGLSIGSHDDWSPAYLALLDQLFPALRMPWHSEHLAYAQVDGEALGTMVEMPRTEEALRLIGDRVCRLQDRYGAPFLLENVARALPDDGADEYSAADFLNQVTARSGCGLLLDLYNLECDRHNLGFDVEGFLDELDLGAVREVHIAGGTLYRGFRLDIHSRLVEDSTLELAARTLPRCASAQALVFEVLHDAVELLGAEAIAAELVRIRARLFP